MRKCIAVLMCVVVFLCITGCGKSTAEKNKEAKEFLTKVLNYQESFTVHNTCTEKTTVENLEKFRYPNYSNALNIFKPQGYVFNDFDRDGIDELLIVDSSLSDFLFLRYENGKALGCVLSWLSIPDVRTDGTFKMFRYKGYEAICSITFSGESYEIFYKAYKDDSKNEYLLNGKPAEKQDVIKYFEEWNTNTEKVEWNQLY